MQRILNRESTCNTLADTLGDICSDVGYNIVKFRVKALGLYNFVRGFAGAYNRRGIYPGDGGLITRITNAF